MRPETILSSILLGLAALLAFQLPGVPVAGPAIGVFVVLFLATRSIGGEVASKLRYLYAFFLFLVPAAANKGSVDQVAIAIIAALHFFTWTEGLTSPRRYAVKNGEPLPPDGRRAIYSLAFCAAVALSYLFLDGNGSQLPLFLRSLLAFAAVTCGFCLWDVGYVTRLQRATRFRRPAVHKGIRMMQVLVIAAVLTLLFLLFGRAIPATAFVIHDAASELRNGTHSLIDDTLKADRDRAPEPGDWRSVNNSWLHPHRLPAEGEFRPDPSFLLAMSVPDPEHRGMLLESRVYIRGYAMKIYAQDEWNLPEDSAAALRMDAQDGTSDDRVVVKDRQSATNRNNILHDLHLLEPFQELLPAIQGVTAYHLEMLAEKPDEWYGSVGSSFPSYTAESTPSLFSDLRGNPLVAGNTDPEYLSVPETPLSGDMQQLIAGVRGLPLANRIDGVVDLLRERCSYSMRIRNPGKFSALENFLYGEKEGMCIHYATAATLLLRLVDVPSRIAFGFSGGEYYDDEDVFAFRGRHAHVWTEVLLDGHGWTVVDPTPERQGASHAPARSQAPEEYLAKIAGRETESDTLRGGDSGSPWMRRLRELPWGTITMSMLGCIFLGALLISWRQRKSENTGGSKVLHFSDPNAEAPKYLTDFYKLCERNFGVRKSRSETLLEFVGQLKRSGALKNQFDALCDYHYGVYYRDFPRDKQRETSFRETARAFERRKRA